MNQDAKNLRDRYLPKAVHLLKPDRQLYQVRFSIDGKLLAAGGCDGSIRRWDLSAAAPAELPPLRGHNGWVQAIAIHPDGKRLFSADSWGTLCCWPVIERDATPLWTKPKAHDGWIRSLALSADGKLLATCGFDRKVRIWSNAGQERTVLTSHDADVFAVAFHPDGKAAVSGDLLGNVRHWDLATGKCPRVFDAKSLHRLDRLQDVGGVRCLAFDKNGATLAVAGTTPKGGANVQGTPTVLLFDWAAGKLSHTLKVGGDGDGFVYDLCWHPDGFVMAVTSGNPGTGKLFFQRPMDAQPFHLAANMANCHSLAFHADRGFLAVAATNAGSNGNGRMIGKNKDYPGNSSPVHILKMGERPA